MKSTIKLIIALFFTLFIVSSCNKYIACPAYSDAEVIEKTIQNENS